MPFYMEGEFYFTQVELRDILKHLLETCWMYSHCRSKEERKFLTDSITANFKMDHPEFETRKEADDIAMQARYQAYMQEEEIRRKERAIRDMEAQKATRVAHLQGVVSRGYHPEFYPKFCRFVDKCNAGIPYNEHAKLVDKILYFNPHSFVEVPKDVFYRPMNGEVITVRDGGLQPILVVIRDTPILQLYNLEHSIENTNQEYIYGMVLDAPDGVPYPKNARIILQIKHICSLEGKISLQKEESEILPGLL